MINHLKMRSNIPSPSTNEVEEFFEGLNLPIPQKDEFFKTSDGGTLTLLTEFACTVRITPRYHYPQMQHPRVLHPLILKSNKDFHMIVNPGLRAAKATYDREKMNRILDREGVLKFDDLHADNIGLLPPPYDYYAVLIDPDCITRINQSSEHVKRFLEGDDRQAQIFSPLRERFADAWPEECTQPDPSKIKEAWETCRQLKKDGALDASWTQRDYSNHRFHPNNTGTTKAAIHYANRIKKEYAPEISS